ncbi:MAG: hypothetical protein H5U06_09055 [Candidatus Aminicenantes bacterium]|nr:hypothetical protein [Candidatus Aminicenantes bacterium]
MKKILSLGLLMILTVFLIIPFGLKAENCAGICPDPNKPCCCEERDGYYLINYSCACAGGQLQWQECRYAPLKV